MYILTAGLARPAGALSGGSEGQQPPQENFPRASTTHQKTSTNTTRKNTEYIYIYIYICIYIYIYIY